MHLSDYGFQALHWQTPIQPPGFISNYNLSQIYKWPAISKASTYVYIVLSHGIAFTHEF